MADPKLVHVRVYGDGHCDLSAEASEALQEAVKDALSGCVRLTPSIDRADFVRRLTGRGVPQALADQIAKTMVITDDDAFFNSRRPH